MEQEKSLAVFQNKKIRRIWNSNEWYFSVIDVVEALTDGANTKSLFRIIRSIPSRKAEPFKLWLAKVGYERVQEIENPELSQERMKEVYEKKGYSKSWIDKRLRVIAVRQDLTDEWKKRGINEQVDFSILTAEISKATFGMAPSQYKKFKNLDKENLRDHMTDLELIFAMLGEASTTEIEKVKDPKTFPDHKKASREGSAIANLGLILWREEKFNESKELFMLLLKLNKNDNQGIRYLVAAIHECLFWEKFGEIEDQDSSHDKLEELFEKQNKIHKFFEYEEYQL